MAMLPILAPVLPGWVFNVALIVHSEEALLASRSLSPYGTSALPWRDLRAFRRLLGSPTQDRKPVPRFGTHIVLDST